MSGEGRAAADGAEQAEAILQASLRLFAEKGFDGATTREIADAVGLKQASMFYYFAHKEDILEELLARTVNTSLDLRAVLTKLSAPSRCKLWLLIYLDVSTLCKDDYRGVRLMLLPNAQQPRYRSFWDKRVLLRGFYGELIAATLKEAGAAEEDIDLTTSLIFGMSESPVTWYDTQASSGLVAELVADSALAVVLRDRLNIGRLRSQAYELLASEGL